MVSLPRYSGTVKWLQRAIRSFRSVNRSNLTILKKVKWRCDHRISFPNGIHPSSKADLYKISRPSTASSLPWKSANQQFFNSCLNNHAVITELVKSLYSSIEFWLRMISSSLKVKIQISRSKCLLKTKTPLHFQNLL